MDAKILEVELMLYLEIPVECTDISSGGSRRIHQVRTNPPNRQDGLCAQLRYYANTFYTAYHSGILSMRLAHQNAPDTL